MKYILATLFCLMSLAASASSIDSEAIYEALDVEEVDPTPGILGAKNTEKSVGGLVCTKSVVVVPNAVAKYHCTLDEKSMTAEDIYEALAIDEIDPTPGILGAKNTEKAVGGLVCAKSVVVVPNAVPTYNCALN